MAADDVFATSERPGRVSMDEVAQAAGIGKGTLFRLFGSRVGLLDALFDSRLGGLLDDIAAATGELGEDAPVVDKAVIAMRCVTRFKLVNSHLMRAREGDETPLYDIGFYRALHELLVTLYREAAPDESRPHAEQAMHVLLGAAQVELLDELLLRQRQPLDAVLEGQDHLVRHLFTP